MFNAVIIIGLLTLAIYTIVDRICKAKENCALCNAMAPYLIKNTNFGDITGATIKNMMNTMYGTKEK